MINFKDNFIGAIIKLPAKVINQGTNIYEFVSTSFQGVKRLFVLL